jgi:hypothetical protein
MELTDDEFLSKGQLMKCWQTCLAYKKSPKLSNFLLCEEGYADGIGQKIISWIEFHHFQIIDLKQVKSEMEGMISAVDSLTTRFPLDILYKILEILLNPKCGLTITNMTEALTKAEEYFTGCCKKWNDLIRDLSPEYKALMSFRKEVQEFLRWLMVEFLRTEYYLCKPFSRGQYLSEFMWFVRHYVGFYVDSFHFCELLSLIVRDWKSINTDITQWHTTAVDRIILQYLPVLQEIREHIQVCKKGRDCFVQKV